jgi:hypothetical protein
MSNKPLLGVGKHMIPIPRYILPISRLAWGKTAKMIETGLSFFISKEHHSVRDFVATELLRIGSPISPEFIAKKLNLSVDRVKVILDEWKRTRLLLKNEQGAVTCVYPVRISTPHCTSSLHNVIFSPEEKMQTA